VAVLADGCNWGLKPREAAVLASNTFINHMANKIPILTDTHEIGIELLRGFMMAHAKIIETKEDPLEAGTTTLIGGALVEVDVCTTSLLPSKRWAFVCASVGDSKAFLYSKSKHSFEDVTASGNRDSSDVTDCGGRLGPQLPGANPDLRNLSLSMTLVDEGDCILLVSDGIHDNFDPQMLGFSPAELGIQHSKTWAQAVCFFFILYLLANSSLFSLKLLRN